MFIESKVHRLERKIASLQRRDAQLQKQLSTMTKRYYQSLYYLRRHKAHEKDYNLVRRVAERIGS